MSNFTKGPWVADGSYVISPTYTVADIWLNNATERYADRAAECHANAHLIAAAPELLEALKAIFEDNCFYHKAGDERCYALATKAIAKAEGK